MSGNKNEEVIAPLPGKVVDVKVQEGIEIKADDVVLILEAMKMEIEVGAETNGIVKEIRVKPGEVVNTGQLLAIIESDVS